MAVAVRHLPPGALPMVHAAAFDVVFAAGVLHGPVTPTRPWSPWLEVPATWMALVLPLVLLVTVVVAVTGPRHPSSRSGLHPLQVATIALAVLGIGLYVSPWGRAGVATLLES